MPKGKRPGNFNIEIIETRLLILRNMLYNMEEGSLQQRFVLEDIQVCLRFLTDSGGFSENK